MEERYIKIDKNDNTLEIKTADDQMKYNFEDLPDENPLLMPPVINYDDLGIYQIRKLMQRTINRINYVESKLNALLEDYW